MERMLVALVIGIGAGIVLGTAVAKRSNEEDKIHGGDTARKLHWLACAAFGGGVPAGLSDILLGNPLGNAVVLALIFIGTSFVALVLFALVEQEPRRRALALAAEQGWTAEKAKTSGL